MGAVLSWLNTRAELVRSDSKHSRILDRKFLLASFYIFYIFYIFDIYRFYAFINYDVFIG